MELCGGWTDKFLADLPVTVQTDFLDWLWSVSGEAVMVDGLDELPVSCADPPAAVHLDPVLVIGEGLHNGARLVPLEGVTTRLILNHHDGVLGEGDECLSVFTE